MEKLNLGEFLEALEAQHTELAVAFEAAQAAARKATQQCKTARNALVAFRAEYGGHLKVIADGQIKIPAEADE